MSRVRLLQDFKDQWGRSFTKGQTGTSSKTLADRIMAVHFDTYQRQDGEPLVPWPALVPADLLEAI